MADCLHCGTHVASVEEGDQAFCCQGCRYVYGMIHSEGLDRFYELKDSPVAPVRPGVLEKRDLRWLETAVAGAEEDHPREARIDLDLEGVSCVGCVWLLEKVFQRYPGGNRIEINPQLGQLRAYWKPGIFDWTAFAREIQRFGYLLIPAGTGENRGERHHLSVRMGLCGAFAMNAMLFTLPRYLGMDPDFEMARLFHWLTLLFATLSMLVGASYFIQRSFEGLRRGVLHIDFPIALGVSLAFLGSLFGWIREWESFIYFDFVSVFTFLMLVGRWVQEKALEYNRRRLFSGSRRPRGAERLSDADSGVFETIPLPRVVPGQNLRVNPGEVIPVASRLLDNAASCSLEWINGESESRTFRLNQIIPGGSINIGTTPLLVATREAWTGSLLEKLLDENRAEPRSPLFERILRIYLVVVILVAICGGLWWALGPPGDRITAMQVVLSVLVVSCPCALGVAAPLAHEWAVLILRRFGLFVREASLFARLDAIRRVVFDKTGTLTLEAPVLSNPVSIGELSPVQRESLRQLTATSGHPYSRAIRQELWRWPMEDSGTETLIIKEHIGNGMASADDRWKLGRSGWAVAPSQSPSPGDCVFSENGKPLAVFHFAESIRRQARESIARLRRRFNITILSGDHPEKVASMAKQLDIPPEDAHGHQSPQDKATWVRRHRPESIMYIGDGANDSLAFDLCGVKGAPVVERGILDSKADFFFTGSGLQGITALFQIARTRAGAARSVFAFSVVYNIGVGIVALMGKMNPLLAAVLMPLSSVATIAIVALRYRQRRLPR